DGIRYFHVTGVQTCALPIYRYVLEEDPHVRARGMIGEFDHPVEGRTSVLASPLRFSATPSTIRTPPPLLGQHTAEVREELARRRSEERRVGQDRTFKSVLF